MLRGSAASDFWEPGATLVHIDLRAAKIWQAPLLRGTIPRQGSQLLPCCGNSQKRWEGSPTRPNHFARDHEQLLDKAGIYMRAVRSGQHVAFALLSGSLS